MFKTPAPRLAEALSLAVILSVAASLVGASEPAPNNNAADLPQWASDVAPIVHSKCTSCHRPGQGAPMSLRSYNEVRPWAKSIARKVETGEMPPWHAAPGSAGFSNDRSLEESEIDTIVRWAKGGAPAGDLSKEPAAPEFPTGKWRLGEPDHIVELPEVTVPAGGPDQFHNLVGQLGLDEDKWVTAVEILPGNSTVVHHVITFAVKGFDVDPVGGWLGAWAAGTDPMVFAEGTGRLLEKGSNLIGDMHYHPTDTEQKDITRIGLHFADQPPAKELTNIWIMNDNFKIPAGASDHEVRAERLFWQDGRIMAFAPHMHYRGKKFVYRVHYPDGRTIEPLKVLDYDFNWQTNYKLEDPIPVTAGTRVEVIAHYDNSAGNPDNPDPTIDVTFGDESYDEMMIGFLDFIVDEGVAPLTPFQIRGRLVSEVAKEHPGEVWKVSGREPEKRDDPEAWAPIHLPAEGDGTFWVIWGDRGLMASTISDLVWDGNQFSGQLLSPWGPLPLEGEVNPESGSIKTVMTANGRKTEWDGSRADA